MADSEDDARYHSAYNSSTRSKHSNRNPSYPINSNYRDDNDEEEYEDDEFGEEDEGINQEFNDQEDDDEDEDEEDVENGYDESKRRQKKRRIESLVSNYEFVPRNPTRGAQNSPSDWTDHSTLALLEEVAEKVSEGLKAEWTDMQCRNRLDTLKKKYKKEKSKMEAMAGEYVFMNTRVYLDRSNGLDEMRDSPGESESYEDDDEDSDGLPPKRRGIGGEENDGSSFGLLADSIQKFGEIYEKIESSKRQQMMELEKMRMDFQRELEVQKKQILERAQAEIAKIRQGDDDDETDVSAENFSENFVSRTMTMEPAAILEQVAFALSLVEAVAAHILRIKLSLVLMDSLTLTYDFIGMT
ncbi:alcohol dehydrogenase transcription factor Myb/SANT-like family protein [Actinidia rufa]|uniref:Alcohol dehydrogenase transcription factor Myb/SANT-like family protein n=1 Tax=Actinidia rufa TaxID=165716 RepID=A0A7J0FC93_9ERIC|nr:alcohol dehydrogenase transcription factor Myb/SANT-like family protein [Actinidia rufa]